MVLAAAVAADAGQAQQGQLPRYAEPVLITSAGQGPDSVLVEVLAQQVALVATHDAMASGASLEGVRTLLVAVGGSVKGLGAAGITTEQELARIRSLLGAAKSRGVPVVAVHIGGESRRGPLSQPFIDATLPYADALVVFRDGNRDQFFTRTARQLGIPLVVIQQVLELKGVLDQMFHGGPQS